MSTPRNVLFVLAGVVALAGLAGSPASGAPMPLATGGPDTFGYRYIDVEETGGPTLQFEDIGTSGAITIGTYWDDTVVNVNMGGISFPYYGTNYTSVNVSSNGNVHFGSANSSYTNASIPTASAPLGMIAPMWDDLVTDSGTVRTQAFTSAPRRFIVQWNGVSHISQQGVPMTFQVKLYESGLISFQYQTMTSGLYTNGSSATTGIQNISGTVGLQYQINGSPGTNNLYSGLVINYSVGSAPDAPAAPFHTDVSGGTAKPDNFLSDASIFFRSVVTDPDVGQTVGLQVEILPAASPFAPTAVTGVLASSPMVAINSTAEAPYVFTGTPFGTGDYHWRARTIDNFGMTSTWTTPVNDLFRVDIVPPSQVVPLEPLQDAQARVEEPTGGPVNFAWDDPVDGGPAALTNYDFEVDTDVTFSAPIYAVNTTSKLLQFQFVPSPLPNPQAYYWRARVNDEAGNLGAWLTPIRFYVIQDSGRKRGAGDGLFGDKATCSAESTPRGAALAAFALMAGMAWVLRRK